MSLLAKAVLQVAKRVERRALQPLDPVGKQFVLDAVQRVGADARITDPLVLYPLAQVLEAGLGAFLGKNLLEQPCWF